MIKFKIFLIKIILGILTKIMDVVYENDDNMKELVKNLSSPVKVNIKVIGTNIDKKINISHEGIKNGKNINDFEIIEINIKHISDMLKIVTGRKSMKSCYVDKMITVKGNLADSVCIMEIVNLAESYLLPKFMNKKIFDLIPKRNVSKYRILLKVIV